MEADCKIKFKLQNGALVNVELSRTRNLGAEAIIYAENGTINIGLVDSYLAASPPNLLLNNYSGISGKNIPMQSYVDLMNIQINNWIDAINNQSFKYVSGEDVAPSIFIMEECYKKKSLWHFPWIG